MPTNIPLLRGRRVYPGRSVGNWWMVRGRTPSVPPAGLDFEIYEGGSLVGGRVGVTMLEIYESGALVGDTTSLTTLEIYESGLLVGSVP